MENWYKILSTTEAYKAEIIKNLLEENNIEVILLNKQDSSYVFLGDIEIYVPVHLKNLATDLINGAITN
ncbi:putative signal transducing protein [Pollutibacter soli]|uniref:putative signal transducing protein n=1 Tax=Pollutibacter soli TaxID=3034157 RepID=UPI00301402F3